MQTLNKLNQIFANELIFLQNNLTDQNDNSIHKKIINHLINKKSKKIRFLLVILIGQILQNSSKNLLYAAMAVEIIHNATLIHDDIIDESDFRHGLETAHKIWGNKISILIGDYLFMQALLCIARTQNMKLIDEIAHSTRTIIDGEITNLNEKIIINNKKNYQIYMQWIESKTATLFALSTKIPAILHNKSENEILQWQILGNKIGIAFQIIDDVMDYQNIDKFGKEIGKDFYNGQITLPIIFCIENAQTEELTFWQRIIEEKKFQKNDWQICINSMKQNNAIEKTKRLAMKYINDAQQILFDFEKIYAQQIEFINLIRDLIQDLYNRML